MKLILVSPYFGSLVSAPTLGLGFLATYVRENSPCEVEIFEPVGKLLDENKLFAKVKEADFLGLVCYTESRFQCFDFAMRAKQANPACKIIVGGPHATALDMKILEHYPFIDFIIRAEGERPLLDLILDRPLEDIGGLTWRSGSKVIRNPEVRLDRQIDKYHLDYSLIWPEIKDWKDDEVPYKLQKMKNLPFIASRGCPFNCSFCAAHQQWCGTWRGYSAAELVAQLKYLVDKYGIGYVRFYDALFIGNEKYALEFCDAVEKSGLNIKFRIDIRAGTSREVLARLREVGCEVIGLGIESGSPKILERINKKTSKEKIYETINICKELNYWLIGFFMMSLPDEEWSDFKETLELVKYFDVFNFQFFKIHPNTQFYEELKQKGEIDDNAWFDRKYGEEIFYSRESFPSAHFYRRDLGQIEKSIYHEYNLRRPLTVFKRYGAIKGVIKLFSSALQILLLSNKSTARLLDNIKKSWVGKLLKSRRFVK